MRKLTHIFLMAACLVFPFGNLLRSPIGNGVALLALDVCVGAAFLTGLPFLWGRRKDLAKDTVFRWFAVFVCIAALALLFNASWLGLKQVFIASLYLIRFVVYASLLWIADRQLQKPLLYSGGAMIFLGLAQYVFFPDLRPWFGYGWDEHLYRLFGTLLDPNFTGAVFVLSLAFLVRAKASPAMIAVTLLAIFLTYSRSTYLMLLASMLTYALLIRSAKVGLLCVGIVILGLLLIPKNFKSEGVDLLRTASISQRAQEYQQALNVWTKHPLGVGFNAYQYAQEAQGFVKKKTVIEDHSGAGVPNSYLFVLVTTGIAGLLAYLGWIMAMMKRLFHAKEYVLFATTSGLLIHAFFENSLFYPFVLFMLFIGYAVLGHQSIQAKHR
ncbi:hypothetical protein A3B02_02185 [Candidatus Roizmanbacteria bacterium RIFCSPLOWO2_01_FULL_42_14]|uniref:O-antigen ligase-related domain-containing protein n=4 Tax=Candidatus Roizmaniibacteriota TaxID=1752723 RepID=A0A1F7K290_9BACT|nr:MAG: hypothetical protein A3F32_01570 [Candidatus Roizmanbacteria bacterium RIFCSPHIGHO2_12_FULL_42_10]OGK51933.1 MAG: hypothetical protein A3B02_02185 [Candidatus Roizmanbacteria bacterium RIFCSPLOWO2_01_FULL_42_14]OGK61946.1 MAG: hypothetical protein A3I56_02355 [Candidatus Roizmanbacteria bacterium RIFCSPLOWO2_02_FULL_43_10]